jgi:thioredoxin
MLRLPVLAFAIALAAPACAEDKKDDPKGPDKPGAFQKLDYDKAVARARSDKKIVMIDFYADWCGPCKLLDQKTFSEEKVQKFLTDKTVAIKVNTDDNPKLAEKYKVNAIPCLVFIDGEGKEVGRLVGFRAADKFLEEAEKFAK